MAKRYAFFTALLLVSGLAAQAQAPVHRYFQAEEPMNLVALRDAMQAVNDLDPHSTVFYSDDFTLLHIKASPQVSTDELRAVIATTGIVLKAGDHVPETPTYTALDGSPLYVATGDAEGDRARYAAALAAWNAAHPEQQLEMPAQVITE